MTPTDMAKPALALPLRAYAATRAERTDGVISSAFGAKAGWGGERIYIFYSFFACCKLNGVAPGEWLADVMRRLPAHPINRIEELLPLLALS